MASIELIYLQHPVHPNITVIQVGPGISRIDEGSHSYWVHGSPDGPLAGKWVEIPKANIAAVQWCKPRAKIGRHVSHAPDHWETEGSPEDCEQVSGEDGGHQPLYEGSEDIDGPEDLEDFEAQLGGTLPEN